MEHRDTLTPWSEWALPAGWHLGQVLAWICLLVVASTTAYGLQLAAASIVPTVADGQHNGSYQGLDGDDIREQRAALLQAASTSLARMVLITGLDATTGDRTQVECLTAGGGIASDALSVDLQDLPCVAALVCNVSSAPVLQTRVVSPTARN